MAKAVLRYALLVLVVAYGALLRFDALTLTYGPVERPAWLRAVQESRADDSALRPDTFRWQRWEGRRISDPYTYLRYAREMRNFYAAHRREPVFPFATKVFLWLLHDHDSAVSFASATFSVLAILTTFVLGAYAFNYWVGLGAAALTAIEYDIVSSAVVGWRDDAFMWAVLASAYAMVRYARAPSTVNAVLAGLTAGIACLIRITSLSFLLPGLAVLLLQGQQSWRERLRGVATAAIVMTVLIAPFLINCWRVYGDPLYSINVHADVYREAEGQKVEQSSTAASYLRGMAQTRPFRTLDTAVLGMTTYPFLNKWQGFDRWMPHLGTVLSYAALLGLFLFLGSPGGRLLLVIIAGSLVPYALTWRLIFDWRFTEHAYPFFLIASCFALWQVAVAVSPARLRALRSWRPRRKAAVLWVAALAAVVVGTWSVARVLPVLVAREAIAAGERTSVPSDERDGAFFGEGWSEPVTAGVVRARVSTDAYAHLRLPLSRVQDYDATLRMDPFPRPAEEDPADLPIVRVFLNNRLLSVVELTWNPERVGAYQLRIPAATVGTRTNRLVLMPVTRSGGPARIRFWYIRIGPAAASN